MNAAEITVRIDDTVDPAALIALYKLAGWWTPADDRDDSFVAELIRGSFLFAAAHDGDRLIGMARAISDGASDAYIQDVFVHPDFRGRGIAGRLVRLLIAELQARRVGWIGLIAEPGSEVMYAKFGFQRMVDYVPMLLRQDP